MTSSNIGDVRDSVGDTKDELQRNIKREGENQINQVKTLALSYLMRDANWTGNTLQAIEKESDTAGSEYSFSVYVDGGTAPYAEVVELGSGEKTDVLADQSPANHVSRPDSTPSGYPFEAPELTTDLILSILNWIETKPIPISGGDKEDAAFFIARQISEEGTPMHPFMIPAWDEKVKSGGSGSRWEGELPRKMNNAIKDAFE